LARFGGNLTVIKARRSAYNYFMSVQSEPGSNSTYFDFDEHSLWNTVIVGPYPIVTLAYPSAGAAEKIELTYRSPIYVFVLGSPYWVTIGCSPR
jgi:hypothetical protein